MDPNSAAENLQVIRTLMERSALYRRALAPVMLAAGVLGLAGWFIGDRFHLDSFRAFVIFWFTIAFVVIGVALLIIRRQALSSQESFWTPPTKRIAQAMIPPLFAGFLVAISPSLGSGGDLCTVLVAWPLLYGCALHSAGLFVSRGVRLLGWSFIIIAVVIWHMQSESPIARDINTTAPIWFQPHTLMGLTFGGLHLIASLYLYVTEKRKNAQ